MSFKRAPPCCGSDERSFRLPISWGFFNRGFYLSFAFCCLLLQGFPKPSCFFGNIWYSVERNMLNASNHQVKYKTSSVKVPGSSPIHLKRAVQRWILWKENLSGLVFPEVFTSGTRILSLWFISIMLYTLYIYIQSIFLKDSVGPVWTSNLTELYMKCPLKRRAMRVLLQSTLSFESPWGLVGFPLGQTWFTSSGWHLWPFWRWWTCWFDCQNTAVRFFQNNEAAKTPHLFAVGLELAIESLSVT